MKKILIILLIIVVLVLGFLYFSKDKKETVEQLSNQEMMELTLYLQNKEVAKVSDCGVTYKITKQIPKTTGVLDASLKILFQDELSRYGQYDSVKIENGIAQVKLKSSNTSDGSPIGSLSSCEVQHLNSVLKDTLTQYPGVTSVQLYSPVGRIEF